MTRRLPTTPRSKVRQSLRQLSLRSRERQAALKAAGYCCESCGVKRSVAKGREVKVEAHHRNGIDWEALIDLVYERLLVPSEQWACLCEDCHKLTEVTDIAREVGL